MKRNITIVIVVLIITAAVISIRLANDPVLTEPAQLTTIENSISADGFIVRDESAFYATSDGTPYFNLTEGTRVSKDALVATIFNGKVKKETLKALSIIDAKLSRAYEEASQSRLHKSDETSIESDIMSRVSRIYDYARDGDIEKISETRSAINSLRQTGEYSLNIKTEELEEEKRNLRDSTGFEKKEIFTDISGVFSTYFDGLESVLQPEKIEQYPPSYIKNLQISEPEENENAMVKTGDPICKVMNNHVWYVLVPLPYDRVKECKKGMELQMRFRNMADTSAAGTVEYISEPDENNDVLMLLRCSQYIESVFSYRKAEVDIIFKSYTGYKVPTHAVRTTENGYKVIAQASGKQFECEVEVLYTDSESGYSIIQSAEDAANRLSKAERIVVGDKER